MSKHDVEFFLGATFCLCTWFWSIYMALIFGGLPVAITAIMVTVALALWATW